MKRQGSVFERPPRSGVFWISFYDPGSNRRRERVGTRKEAIARLELRNEEVADGKYAPRGSETFHSLAMAALADKKLKLRPQSYATDEIRLRRLLRLIGRVPISELGRASLRAAARGSQARRACRSNRKSLPFVNGRSLPLQCLAAMVIEYPSMPFAGGSRERYS
jgi:hypothetical protein